MQKKTNDKMRKVTAYLYLIITLLSFSSIEVISKPLMGKVDPFFLTAFRFLLGGLFLAFFVRETVEIRDFINIFLIGLLNSVISMTSLQLSVKYSNASTAATLVASNPIFVSLFAWLILKERYNIKKYIGIVLGFFGLMIFSIGKMESDSWLGIFFGIFAALTFGLYTVLMRKYTKKYDALRVTAYSSLTSGLIYLGLISLAGGLKVPNLYISDWLIVIFLGIVVTGIAYLTFFRAMEVIGTAQASRIFFLKPVVATLLALLLLGEGISVIKIIGVAIILVSLSL
ncbi:MAG: DMT family transporter [Fervidobacterium sp.]